MTTTLKIKFKAPSSKENEGTLYYEITHNKETRKITTNYKIQKQEWNSRKSTLIIDTANTERKNHLYTTHNKIQNDKRLFESILQKTTIPLNIYTIDDLAKQFHTLHTNSSLYKFMEYLITTYKKHNQDRTAETYTSTLNSIKRFMHDKELQLTDITPEFITTYKQYLKRKNLQHNTISFYLYRLRAVYNKAVEQDLIEQKSPFKHQKIGIEKTIKRAIPIKYIKRLKSLNLKEGSSKALARDIFLFSFYTRGMSYIDIAYLQKKDLKNGTLTYRRKKTGQKLYIHWEKCMEQIANKYHPHTTSPYLLAILDNTKGDLRKQYRNTLTLINRKLKELGKEIGLDTPLTMYVARHSWATTAHSERVPLSIISEGMGHNSERTTQIYLASLDNKIIDNANRKIIKLLQTPRHNIRP